MNRRAPPGLRLAPHVLLLALVAGTLASSAVRLPAGAGLVLVGLLGAGALLGIACDKAQISFLAACACVGLAAWSWGGARLRSTTPERLHFPLAVKGEVVLTSAPLPATHGTGLRARATTGELRGVDGGRLRPGSDILVALPGEAARWGLGARLLLVGTLADPVSARSPGWWRAYLAREGIAGRLRVRQARLVGRRGGLEGLRDRLRSWAGRQAAAGLDGDRAALVRGMALGGAAGLSLDASNAFRRAGLWHLLAVSGQNVAVVALAALAALRTLGVRRLAAVAAAGLLLVIYCLACDGGASVARAGVMGGLGVLAELGSRPRERWYLLLAGLAAILLVQPRAIGDPGLQLSFAAVVGLFSLAPVLSAWARGWLPPRLADLAGQSLGAGLATGPVLAWHFGRLSLVGFAVNVLAVPVAGPIVVLALAGIVAGALLPAAGLALAWVAGVGAAGLLGVARLAASVPGASVELPPAAALPLMLLPVLPPLAWWWLGRVPSRE